MSSSHPTYNHPIPTTSTILTMSALFTPLKVGSTTIPNRIGMAALTRNRSTGTVPNEIMLNTITEWPQAPGIWDKAQIEGWKKITDAVHGAGGTIYAQVLGRLSHPDAPEQIAAGEPVYAPSAISARGGKFRFLPGEPGYVTPTEIVDPTVFIAQFKQAAINAKEAGFDGVELHAANGYLVQQFLDFNSNKRTDKWGGSPENRARFAIEILKALIEVWGLNVAMKLSPDIIDTFGYLLREANKLNLAYVTLMKYSAFLDPEYDGDGKKRATQHDVIETFTPFLTKIPVFANAGVTPAEAEKLVGSGKAGKQLDNPLDWMTLYGAEGVDPALGYVDYKEATY
ncbi:hypothetical protein B0H14DRAFT_2710482 [Mycena olivaceomarginata]|nr:hypothetical protein B0H14DRAFT_2710482 [Mycena olivaceomarginata]